MSTPEEKCPFGCIFDGDRLTGDCRIPWSRNCELRARGKIRKAKLAKARLYNKRLKEDKHDETED